MEAGRLLDLIRWITEAGLSGSREVDLLQGMCERAQEAGLRLYRVTTGIDALHPVQESYGAEWRREAERVRVADFSRTAFLGIRESWLRSPLHHLDQTGAPRLRRRLDGAYRRGEFPILDDLHAEGVTDYLAAVAVFGASGQIGLTDRVYSSWATDRPGGFADEDLEALEAMIPALALAIKGVTVVRIAEGLVETYLGRDAGHRVLRGHIERGVAERIRAILWFSDLRGFTKIADTVPAEQLVPLLNDYADALASAIHDHDGQVLKFMGDGILATFDAGESEEACRNALDATEDARRRVLALNARRSAEALPTTQFYLGLHVGEVFYGNIGSSDRLDFTVVGPAVNEVSRIAGMCRSLDQEVVLSSAFFAAAGRGRDRLVSLGRYALRGVQRPQALYTIDPDGPAVQP